MKFSLAIYSPPSKEPRSDTALCFASELLKQGHSIYRLFFFNSGVHHCAATNTAWQEILNKSEIDAIVCMASAQKRGFNESTLSPFFNPGGIAQLIDASVHSDRLITFGGQ